MTCPRWVLNEQKCVLKIEKVKIVKTNWSLNLGHNNTAIHI